MAEMNPGLTLALAPAAGWVAHRLAERLTGARGAGPAPAVLLAMLAAVSACLAAPAHQPSAASLCLGGALTALALADLAALRLPDALTLPLTGAGLVVAAFDLANAPLRPALSLQALAGHAAAAAMGYLAFAGLALAYRRMRGRDGLGLGDAKLAAAAGAWLGWRPLPLMVLLACGLAFAWIGVRLLRKRRAALSEPIAFGAPLALALWICWLVRADLWFGL